MSTLEEPAHDGAGQTKAEGRAEIMNSIGNPIHDAGADAAGSTQQRKRRPV